MGITADLQNLKSLDLSNNADGVKRILKRYVNELIAIQGDPDYLVRDTEQDEEQSIAIHVGPVSPGSTFTLTFKLFDGTTFTTAAIPFDATSATIEGIIDTAAAAVVAGWTNGDIATAGGPLTTTPLSLGFSGTSVAKQKHHLTTEDSTNMSGGVVGAITVTQSGQPNRTSVGAMDLINLVGDSQPIGDLPSESDYANADPGSLHLNPNELVLRMLADEAGIECGDIGVGGKAVRDEHLRLMRERGFAV